MDWCSGKPDANIGELYRILLEMKRNDAANVLFEYDKQQRIIHTPVWTHKFFNETETIRSVTFIHSDGWNKVISYSEGEMDILDL